MLRLVMALAVAASALVAAQPSDAEAPRLSWHAIEGLGGAAKGGPERYSGYFQLSHTHKAQMFFFYFQARTAPEDAPLVLWMTGGPGCSSELAVLYENGPWSLTPDLELKETEYGWDTRAHMVFVDQPVNTGFSFSTDDRDRCYDEECVSNDMLDFLVEFFKARPELEGRDLYVTGESYAGHYVPAVSSRIFQANKNKELKRPINLKGLAVGNGLTVPSIQYGAYADYALERSLIDTTTHSAIALFSTPCRLALEVCDGTSWNAECLLAVQFCQAVTFMPIMLLNEGMNVYDIRKKCEGPLCYDFSRMDEYLNLPETRRWLGVGDRKWEACSPSVHEDMMSDWPHRFDTNLGEMMAAGVRVLIYAGTEDFICNVLGNRRWVDSLEWAGSAEWAAATDEVWTVGGKEAGKVKTSGPLSFVSVSDAGHMVPMDRPKEAAEMIFRFTHSLPLETAAAHNLEHRPRKFGPQLAVE